MALPELTPLQFAVLTAIGTRETFGHDLRRILKAQSIRSSGPAFYQAMARLEEAGMVAGWYENRTVGGQTVKQRRYRLLAKGLRAWHHTRDFYIEKALGDVEGVTA